MSEPHAYPYWRSPPGVRRDFIDGRHGQLHYRIARPARPTRAPLLCFHQSPGSSRMFARFLAAMGTDRLALAADTIGFGESDPPPEPKEVEDFAAAMVDLLDALGLTTVDLMGMHTGSKVAVEVANQRPDRVRRLVLIAAPVFTAEELATFRHEYGGVPMVEDGSFYKGRWDMYVRYRGPHMDTDLLQREMAESVRAGERYTWGHRAAFNYPFGDRIKNLDKKVLVLNTEDDLVVQTRRAKDYMRDGRIVELPADRFGHGMLDADTAAIVDIVRPFLDDPVAPAIADPSAALRQLIASPARAPGFVRRAFADQRWGQLHYRSCEPLRPTKRPLICLHASPLSGKSFATIMPLLAQDRVVLAPDTAGFGESDPPPTPVEIADYAEVLSDFILKRGHTDVDLFGFHTGSLLAVEIALRVPGLVNRLVLYSAPVFSEPELAEFREHYTPVAFTEDGMHNVKRWQSFWRWRGPGQTVWMYANQFAETLRWGPMYSWGHAAVFRHPFATRLGQLENPILVLNPEDDIHEHTKRAAPLLKNGRVHPLPGFGHGMMDTRAPEIAALMRGFLDG
ncbi:MAG: alpha/beta fold hydrolase [Alphaproteobacteria bacterium]|nr:alpha/beta fold hydrolase [Alphaproteobacteria bacterium]